MVTTIDLTQNSLGACVGTLKIARGSAKMIVNGEGQYLKGNQVFWKASVGSTAEAKRITAAVGEKWAKMPEAQGGFGAFCTLSEFLKAFGDSESDSANGAVTIGQQLLIDGVAALEVISNDQPPTTAWVAIESPHYIVKLVTAESTMNFAKFNGPVPATSPPVDKVIDFTKL